MRVIHAAVHLRLFDHVCSDRWEVVGRLMAVVHDHTRSLLTTNTHTYIHNTHNGKTQTYTLDGKKDLKCSFICLSRLINMTSLVNKGGLSSQKIISQSF